MRRRATRCAIRLLNRGKDPQTRGDIELTWDNHRWVRYRSVMTALEVARPTLSSYMDGCE